MRRAWLLFLFGIACAAMAVLGAAFTVHATVHDRIPRFAVLFYATPWPVIAFGAALLTIYWTWRGARVLGGALAVVCVTAFGIWLWQDWRWKPQPETRGQLRVVQWNVDRPVRRLDGDLRWLAAQDADLITIAERHPRNKNTLDRWQAALPDYQLLPSDGEMLCLVRGEILSSEEGSLGYGSYRTLIHARIRGHEMTVLQVDINGYPSESRRPPLQTLAALVAQHRSECLIVLGDFNTPKDSAFFLPLRALAVNAFETAGRGCADTWPMPLPVLSLDQMWTTGQLRPVRCEHMISWRSDHRAVRAEFDFAP